MHTDKTEERLLRRYINESLNEFFWTKKAKKKKSGSWLKNAFNSVLQSLGFEKQTKRLSTKVDLESKEKVKKIFDEWIDSSFEDDDVSLVRKLKRKILPGAEHVYSYLVNNEDVSEEKATQAILDFFEENYEKLL